MSVRHLASPESITPAAQQDELRCGYSSGRCPRRRTDKKGGGLHRFCEVHRQRANRNQRRVDSKRRERRQQQLQIIRGSIAEDDACELPDPVVNLPGRAAIVTEEDLTMLRALLFDDHESGAWCRFAQVTERLVPAHTGPQWNVLTSMLTR